MIPIITGVIASSIAGVTVYMFGGYYSCDNADSVNIYTTSPVLGVGVKLYLNIGLTTEYTDPIDGRGTLFRTGGAGEPAYGLNAGTSQIAAAYTVLPLTNTYDGCGSGTSSTPIYVNGSPSPGTKVYTVCYADPAFYASGTYFTGSGVGQSILNIDVNGEISSVTSCST